LGADQGLAYVASRAHHADIGGAAPGSMPLTNHVEDEGLLIPPTLFAGGEVCCAEVLQQIRGASRQPDERVGDLVAQLGANLRGAARLREVVAAGAREFATTADALIDYAAAMVQSALGSLRQGSATGHAMLESDGLGSEAIPIQVRTSVEGTAASRILTLDFTGTAPAVAGPVNCPRAVATAAVAYCLRCLVPAGTPTNAGMLRDVRIHIPPGCLLDAPFPHPTAAGNVETSQKVVEAVFAALASLVPGGLPAPSQGTMNNILFGGTDPRTGQPFTYYETLAGGCGAGPSGPGASALHSHMTNSRNTPIEVLEGRFPVIVGEYALRVPSGGRPRTPAGFPGGHGVRRAYQFLAQATVTVLADWPALSVPREGDVGSPPKPGAAYLLMHDDGLVPLPSKWSGTVEAGTLLLIATPGGWAWDPPL
ncbi:MAG TPA: hydantoinase B/oxoprolinase family protein, partial [bacterium]|nr:hydantoinase B/oxoprolinase family protein [bacterium]